jgi:hypothetical protein
VSNVWIIEGSEHATGRSASIEVIATDEQDARHVASLRGVKAMAVRAKAPDPPGAPLDYAGPRPINAPASRKTRQFSDVLAIVTAAMLFGCSGLYVLAAIVNFVSARGSITGDVERCFLIGVAFAAGAAFFLCIGTALRMLTAIAEKSR